ncbi:hypothetical protein ACI65C_004337 [Semiaphis heraclei]
MDKIINKTARDQKNYLPLVIPRKHHQKTRDYHHPSQNGAHPHHPPTPHEERRSFSLHQLRALFYTGAKSLNPPLIMAIPMAIAAADFV